MFRRHQLYIMLIWLGLPFAVLIFLALINPDYVGENFKSRLLIELGLTLLISFEVANLLVLGGGFLLINRAVLNPGKRLVLGKILQIALSVVTLLLFTVPALAIVVLWPAITIIMMNTPS